MVVGSALVNCDNQESRQGTGKRNASQKCDTSDFRCGTFELVVVSYIIESKKNRELSLSERSCIRGPSLKFSAQIYGARSL